ncbi:MAG: DUF305 domain-containing protein [Bacteroidetes bacterium]|nr:DUF305 domain-containing protein [Bacteroidota bacterium]MBU1372713.1 DUF305 domain-containing protein [Bacteroidota bacterium]MBU1484909.1 DUF305 domain-containing protein [Bacteroidota bacterium]MBU1761244.1 DUF305 domain-containing protein [Bacteroidota bacterium]MBU2046566.1 DUF305 domain-containing protein [Bacteroidota bacterium]
MEKNQSNTKQTKGMGYGKFAATMGISFVVMYSIMFINIVAIDHFYVSLTRIYMALLMVSPMAIIMLLMMGKMYPDKKINSAIIMGSIVVFGLVLTALRTQTPVGDEQYMKAMIPHHSSAIMTSENANLQDPEVRKLADGIIEAQKKEIAEMKAILARMEK